MITEILLISFERYPMINVCDIHVMKPLLAEHGFHFSKAEGQNFLIASWVPEQIAEDSGVASDVGVLEIGPGIGPLTQQLCRRAGKVCAVEVDKRLAPILKQTVGEFENLEIVWDDVLKQDIPALVAEKLPGLRPMACANLPYYITSPILTALLEADCFEAVTVMVQKEVAVRIAAEPGSADYSAFSVFCQYYAEPELLFDVPAHCFLPQPKVTSAVITLRVRKERPWQITDEKIFFRTVRASFAMRRKKLSNGLASGFPELGKTGAAEVIAACGFDENVRGETLGIPEFARIANAIAERKAHG
jgi:16S rRNA (adenine1518-N6/adenine1519-N6)-dimethyltransferase